MCLRFSSPSRSLAGLAGSRCGPRRDHSHICSSEECSASFAAGRQVAPAGIIAGRGCRIADAVGAGRLSAVPGVLAVLLVGADAVSGRTADVAYSVFLRSAHPVEAASPFRAQHSRIVSADVRKPFA